MDTKEILRELGSKIEAKQVSSLAIMWIDDVGEHIITLGNMFACMGLLRYTENMVAEQIFKQQTTSQIVAPDTIISPAGHG